RARGQGLGGAGARRRPAQHADRSPPGDERSPEGRVTGTSDSSALHLLRELAPQVLGAVARRHGDFAAAEDAVQEALIAAAMQWPVAGVPDNPRGWLYQVAVRRLTDHIRSETARRRREDVVASELSRDEPFVPPLDSD